MALGCSWALPAAAAEGEIQATAAFAVARDPSGQKVVGVVEAALRARVAKARNLRLIEPARALSGDPRTREEETLERARAALADGRRAYDALSLDDAIARLGQAVSLYQQTGPLLGDLEELETALAHLGAALTLRGSADEGESTFLELLTVSPTHQLDGFPPAVEKVFERAATRLEATAAGSVEVYSTPPYAAVFVDGRFEGVTPVTLTDLVAGTHYLRLEKMGYVTHGAPLEVAPNQRITSQTRLTSIKRGAELRDLAARSAEEVLQEGMGGSLRSLVRLLAADTLVFVTVAQSGRDATLSGGVFDAASGARIATERAVLGVESAAFDRDLDAFLGRLLAAVTSGPAAGVAADGPGGPRAEGGADGQGGASVSPSRVGGPPSAGLPPAGYAVAPQSTGTSSEVYLGWTLVGLGGAALITGTVFGILAKSAHSDLRQTSQLSPDLGGLQDRGKTNALVADLCWLGGGLSVVGGAVIVLVAGRSNTPATPLGHGGRFGFAPTRDGGMVSFGGSF